MKRAGMTKLEATREWVREFNAIPQGMIEKLMDEFPLEWEEVTAPKMADKVYMFDLPETVETEEYRGEIIDYNIADGTYCIKLYDGNIIWDEGNFEVEYDDTLPMWGTMWSFGDFIDNEWLEYEDGIQVMSECGFRIYNHEEWGYFFGIDGAGYDFYEAHWCPLYEKRGLKWHDPGISE